ncbi:molybdate ABC transporter substrate-binding protein [Vibrio methylphosphonaticus]|uniref:molybdate ABC transporter substrate-binding protein n=1 Tax=Vibrio methylphosphonaticus TaxID=2946866 RepID=UPI00202A4EFB|nr:molybdate ABC transporter substrate-binding protein [Vibrio methylphosphonaticus]MCL9776319.1 molybdate ABC transporter substrate-binding protein [Vibrio methylphosphonaticus]
MRRVIARHLTVLFIVTLSPFVWADKLTVYAASSMTNAINALAQSYTQQSGVDVTTVFGGSASLARQVYQGAPADVFISANERWVEYLIEQDITSNDAISVIAKNQLVVVSKHRSQPDHTFSVSEAQSWIHALGGGRLAIGMPTSVPAGIYAKQSLESVGVWEYLKTRLAPLSNVRQVLAMVERGETPLGVVYKTDALLSPEIEVLATFDSGSHDAIVYPLVKLSQSKSSQQFVEFVLSNEGQRLLQTYGFEAIDTKSKQ